MSKSARWTCLAIVGLACAGALAPAAPPAPEPTVESLLAEQLKTCEEAIRQFDSMIQAGRTQPENALFDIWMQRWVRTIQTSGMSKAGRIAALESVLTVAKRHEDWVEQFVKGGQASTSSTLDARFGRLDVELALAREKAK